MVKIKFIHQRIFIKRQKAQNQPIIRLSRLFYRFFATKIADKKKNGHTYPIQEDISVPRRSAVKISGSPWLAHSLRQSQKSYKLYVNMIPQKCRFVKEKLKQIGTKKLPRNTKKSRK